LLAWGGNNFGGGGPGFFFPQTDNSVSEDKATLSSHLQNTKGWRYTGAKLENLKSTCIAQEFNLIKLKNPLPLSIYSEHLII
jgi:hypothetical protein